MTETLRLGGLVFEVRRSERRKTLGLTVDRGGELVAHVPAKTSVEELSRWIGKKLLWVHRKLALKEEAAPRMRGPEYVSGEAFCYLGRRYRLKLVDRQEQPLQFDGTRFTLRRDARPAEPHFRRWYIATGADWLRRRVEALSARTASKPRRVEVRDLGFRWGSCGRNGVLLFNWKVLQLPVRLVDYVIVHELVHLREGHHGPAFGTLWAGRCPTGRNARNAGQPGEGLSRFRACRVPESPVNSGRLTSSAPAPRRCLPGFSSGGGWSTSARTARAYRRHVQRQGGVPPRDRLRRRSGPQRLPGPYPARPAFPSSG